MSIKIEKINLIRPLRTASHKNLTKPAIRLPRGTPSQAIAQGHDKNIFSDVDMGSADAITLELMSQHHDNNIQKRKKLNASIPSKTAIKQATHTGRATIIEHTSTDNQSMPYGMNSKTDKENAAILLNTLKKHYS